MSKIILLLALLASTAAFAQSSEQAEIPPPSSTFLPLSTPVIFAWERQAHPLSQAAQLEGAKAPAVESARKEGKKTGEQTVAIPLVVQGAREKGRSREVYRWSDGRVTEKWLLANFIIEEQVDGTMAVIDARLHPAVVANRTSTPFSELSWLRPAYYRGVRVIGGKPCYFYQGKPASEINPEVEEVTSDYSAWIDAQTGLPMASTDGESLWIYKQVEAALPELPAQFQSAREQAEKRYQRVAGRYKPVKI